jgi:hypothetical protein
MKTFINFHRQSQSESNEIKQEYERKIRKVFLKSLHIPMVNIDQLFKEYCQFETVKIYFISNFQ